MIIRSVLGNNQSQTQIQILKKYLRVFQCIEKIAFDLDVNNITESVESSFEFLEEESPYSFNLVVCGLVYSCFVSHFQNASICSSYIKILGEKEEDKTKYPKVSNIIEVFAKFLIYLETQESNYLLEYLIEQNFINAKIVENKRTLYIRHYKTDVEPNNLNRKLPFSKKFFKNYGKLKKDDWEIHKRLVQEGVNPSNIAKSIRNDGIEKLQEISSQANFDFNQCIEPSLYE